MQITNRTAVYHISKKDAHITKVTQPFSSIHFVA